MKNFYLSCDVADKDEIQFVDKLGFKKITSNQTLMSKSNLTLEQLIDIVDNCKNIKYVSVAPKISNKNIEKFIQSALYFANISDKVVIKVPCTEEGYQILQFLKEENIKVNMTLCFSIAQAVIAIALNANWVSIFLGRLQDKYNKENNLEKETFSPQSYTPILKSVAEIIRINNSDTKIIGASIRNIEQVNQSILCGCQVPTIPFEIVKNDMLFNQLTLDGLKAFEIE